MSKACPLASLGLLASLALAVACGGESHAPIYGTQDGTGGATNGGTSGGTGGRTGGSTGGDTGEGTGGGAAGPGSVDGLKPFLSGSALVNYHYDADGVRIVDESGVKHYAWDGTLTAQWEAERPLLSSGYRDGVMVAADTAAIITLDASLSATNETPVVEACVAGTMLSGGRFVCGPNVDWDRVFYTYAASDGALLGTSEAYTYNGVPMISVPGQDLFITVTVDSSPSDYHLYTINDADQATFINESPYHGDFAVTTVVGFTGEPHTHLVTRAGLMLSFANADCNADLNSFDSGCFVKDGNLGTLPGPDAVYAGMSAQQNGRLFALVDPASGSSFGGPCEKGCILQHIDVASRDVLADVTLPALGAFGKDLPANAFYLIPTPDGSSVWLIRSGRSIYETGYDDTLQYDVTVIPFPDQVP
jgi:hypothetical protein